MESFEPYLIEALRERVEYQVSCSCLDLREPSMLFDAEDVYS